MTHSNDELNRKALRVKRMHDDMQRSFRQERYARAELLEAILRAVEPAAEAISGRLTDQHVFDERGVLLARYRRGRPARRGDIEWLVLLSSGEIRRMIEHVGSGVSYELQEVTLIEAARIFDPVDVADTLSELLDQQLSGRASDRTKESHTTAAKLRAVVTLLDDQRPKHRRRVVHG